VRREDLLVECNAFDIGVRRHGMDGECSMLSFLRAVLFDAKW